MLALTVLAISCITAPPSGAGGPLGTAPQLQALMLSDTLSPAVTDEGVALTAARNEWVSFTLQVSGLPEKRPFSLRIRPLQSGAGTISRVQYEAYQIFPMPVDVNRAGYVRHTGQSAAVHDLPRALLPLGSDKGLINLAQLRNPDRPLDAPREKWAGPGPLQLWVDVLIPADAIAGDYAATCDLIPAGSDKPVASTPLKLTVYDFALPAERNLQMVGRISWDSLKRLYPDRFETVTERLLSRTDEKYAAAVRTLDQIVSLAQHHRTGVFIPQLQPTVKWPAGQQPQIDWTEFEGLVWPWLTGEMFSDGVPLGFWPLPAPEQLDRYDPKSQSDYWSSAAAHFDQREWLDRSPIWIEKVRPGPVRAAETLELSARAAELLSIHSRLRVLFPLETDQVQLRQELVPGMIDPADAPRLWAAAPGLVFSPPIHDWEGEASKKPEQWLRTDTPGLVPYAGAGGDEKDVRLWAWLAFLRQAKLIVWNGVLPSFDDPTQPADPNELIWFYPGEWFGIDRPVPTLQLKWLRRAEQDYEYLRLAKERGEQLNTLVMARLMTKLVQIQPGQAPDPSYALMCGTTDPKAWSDAQQLLAKTILLREPGVEPDADLQHALYIETLRWVQPQEKPLLMGRTTQWYWDAGEQGQRLRLKLGIDIYNASDTRPDKNQMQWVALPQGWQVKPQPVEVPALSMFDVRRETMEASFDLSKITPAAQQPSELSFINGFTNRATPLKLVLPVAATERLEGRRLSVDGKLDEWHSADLLQDGPMVKMLSRPAVQRQDLEPASTPARVYSGWAADNFYLAFDLSGISTAALTGSQNFVNYQFRRAWGEDLCQVLIQPVYDKGVGPVLHLVCKPTGHWVERKLDPRLHAFPWQPLEGAGIRYKAALDGDRWVGEVAIPWKAIVDPQQGMPTLLRFNFVQHKDAVGESASWAGPIDFGRDESFTGVLHVKEADEPGVGPRALR